ncbi:CBU_0592 family membrane protein [Primorskyibacter sp. S187A]|uniref:CBU_0592 family membrane protein n=1 Tax=Primorskyibacter sp. S187A TaxID=3415130 RepID=UPI003C7DA79C
MIAYDFSSFDLETLCRALGLIGFAIYVVAFLCLSLGKLDSTRPLYFAMVLVASSCVLASLWADFNLSAALIQGFYIAMSFGAIVLRWRRWKMAMRPKIVPHPPQPRNI